MARKRKTEVKRATEKHEVAPGEPKTVTIEVPDALGLVEHYSYVSHMRVAATGLDVRIAVADLNPVSRQLSGVTGLVMSHQHARDFFRAMKTVVDSLEKHDLPTTTEDT